MAFGRLFKKTYGNTKINSGLSRYRKATKKEASDINKDETLEQAIRRISLSYYGRDYDSLSPLQRQYARDKAKAFRRNIMVRDN